MKHSLLAPALCLFVATALPACRAVPLAMPSPIPITVEDADMGEIIVRGMRDRGWRVVEQEEGRVRARLRIREHTAIVDIHYTGSEVTFGPVSTTNLKEVVSPDGVVTIHRNYNSWLRYLRNDIEDEMLLASTR